jgi:hypothetical protein
LSQWTGTLPTAADGNLILGADVTTILAALHGLADAWTDASAAIVSGGAWTAAGTAPAIGNALVSSNVWQVGKTVHWQASIFFGSTTTFGTSTWTIAWPVAPATIGVNNAATCGAAFLYDNSAATARQAGICVSNGTLGVNFYPGGGTLGVVTNLAPFTWAVSDRLVWDITYQAA